MASGTSAAVLTKATGTVYVERQGTRGALAQGDTIFATDTVITDHDSTAEIAFNDGSNASLSPGTTLEVKDFSFGPEVAPSFILNLAEGTMRSVSGELVKHNPESFKIVTPQATVGIRGTELFTAVMPGGQEVHAVLHIGKGHIVSITSHDGRSIVMDTALQAVNMSDGEHGGLVKQTFQLNELQQLIKNIAPSQVQKPLQPAGADADAQPGNAETPGQETQPAQPAQQGQGDSASAPPAASSAVVVILHEGESATTAQIAAENTTTGVTSAETATLLSVVEQLQGALADAGFTVAIASESDVLTTLQQQKLAADAAVSETVQQTVSQVIETPTDAGKGTVQPPAPPEDTFPPLPPTPERPVPPEPEPDPGPEPGPDPGPNPDPPPDPPQTSHTYTAITDTVVAAEDLGQTPGTGLSITVSGDVHAGAALAANAHTQTQSAATGGDSITVVGTVQGTIYGDVHAAASLMAAQSFGSDTIVVGSVSGGSIYGDAGMVSAAANAITFGRDEITVERDFSSGTIVGDAGTLSSLSNVTLGGDIIIIKGDMTGGSILGDFDTGQSSSLGTVSGGDDEISVEGTMSGGSIHGGVGDDTITVAHMRGGSIFGEEGEDTIAVNAITLTANAAAPPSVVIDGGAGGGSIHVGQVRVEGGDGGLAGTPPVTLASMTISGGNGADSITVDGYEFTGTGRKPELVINLGQDNAVDVVTLTASTIKGNIVINDVNFNAADATADDLIKINGLTLAVNDANSYVRSYGFVDEGVFGINMKNGSSITLHGDFGAYQGDAESMYQRILADNNVIA